MTKAADIRAKSAEELKTLAGEIRGELFKAPGRVVFQEFQDLGERLRHDRGRDFSERSEHGCSNDATGNCIDNAANQARDG